MEATAAHHHRDVDGRAIGIDLSAALALGQAVGADPAALALLLPALDVGMSDAAIEAAGKGEDDGRE